ncbi:MAG: type II secretion system F family protein, partial [Dehalococcoidales bacterium]|nr:type II secretion system F family protein [Dehalococcoidales bacterium]
QAGYKYVLNLQSRAPRQSLSQLIPSLYGVKTSDIIDFSRQLAAFIEAGTSLHSALELMLDQAEKPALKEVIRGLIEKLEGGSSLSQAFKSYPQVFSQSYQQVIQSSEKAGEMEKGLKQMASYLENRAKITSKIRHAMVYPVFVICLAIGVVILLVTTVLPPMLNLFSSFQSDLPPVTLFAIGLMNFFLNYKLQLLLFVIAIIAAVFLLYRMPAGRVAIDRFMLGFPVLGKIIIEHNMGQFCRTVSMLLAAGIPLPGIMDIAIQSMIGNRIIMQAFTRVKDKLMQGEGLAGPMSEETLVPRIMVRMVTAGEQTGTLDTSLDTLAAYFQEHTDKKIQSLIALIEPALTVAIGIGIAFIMVSMVLPIYTIISHVR